MDPLTISAIIGAAGSAGGGVTDALLTGRQNKKSREFALEMWNRQNAYNTPAAQMARFKEAGLNPNLIYGQGNAGNAGAPMTPEFRVPETGKYIEQMGSTAMNAIYDLELKSAQTDNLEAQNDILKQDLLFKNLLTEEKMQDIAKKKFDFDLESELRDTNVEYRRELLRQIRTGTNLSINRDAREAAQVSQSIEESFERILNMRVVREKDAAEIKRIEQNIRLMKQDGTLRQIEINLRKAGINPNSGVWEKAVGSILSNSIKADFSVEDIQALGKRIKDDAWNWLFK